MPHFWWIFSIGTIALLTLGIGLIALALLNQRVKFRLQNEMLALARESEHRYRNLFNNVTDIVYIHSPSGEILDINDTLTRVLGYSVDEVKGRTLAELLPGRFRARIERYLLMLSAGEGSDQSGIIPVFVKGSYDVVILEYRSSRQNGGEGTQGVVHGIARDVTRQKRYERSLRQNEVRMRRLLSQSQAMKENLEALSREMLDVQENERQRISRELHDEISQMITTITMNLEIIHAGTPESCAELLKNVENTQKLTRTILGRIRGVLRELRPPALDELGLLPALRLLVSEFTGRSKIPTGLHGDRAVELLTPEEKMVLYRVVQESLTNAWKHGHPRHVDVFFQISGESVSLEVEDDGEGFALGEDHLPLVPTKGLGLLGMRERVRHIGGDFTVTTEAGKGTVIRVTIPLNGRDMAG